MRILFVLEHFHPYIGGVEFLFLQLCESLVDSGHNVEIITSRYQKSLNQEEIYKGISIKRVNSRNRFTFIALCLPQLFRSAKNVDIIHTTTYTAALPAYLIGWLRRKKTVITFHEYWGKLWNDLPYLNGLERFAFKLFERLVSKLPFDMFVGVSEFTKEALLDSGIPNKRVQKIYNGLDYQRLSKIRESYVPSVVEKKNPQFIFIARIGVSKGIDILLPSLEEVFSEYPTAQLIMVIPKVPVKLYSQIKDDIDKINSNGNIVVLHNLSKEELYHSMLSSNFIIVPSYSEGFCFVAAEACALDIPIVTSQRGALREVVSGKYVEFSELNSSHLSEAIISAIRKEFSVKEQTEFTLENSVKQYIQLYHAMLNR